MAIRFSSGGMEAECFPLRIQADSCEVAQAQGMEEALKLWLVGEFWEGHRAVAVLA